MAQTFAEWWASNGTFDDKAAENALALWQDAQAARDPEIEEKDRRIAELEGQLRKFVMDLGSEDFKKAALEIRIKAGLALAEKWEAHLPNDRGEILADCADELRTALWEKR